KAYLMLFEQIMANYLANLNGIKGLYSIDKEQRNTYWSMALDAQHIEGVHDFYPQPDDRESWSKALGSILNGFDHYHERKNRLLDYLLALYGESFSQNSLRYFDYYYQGREMAEQIVDNKIDYLMAVVELGRDKAKAGDYRGKSWHERASSGLHQRVGRLLGFEHTRACSLIKGVLNQGFKLARHGTYSHLKAGSDELSFIDMEAGELLPVTLWEQAKELSAVELREVIGDSIPLRNNLLSDLLLQGGVELERYRLFRSAERQEVQLCFGTAEGQYWHLGDYADLDSGMQGGNALRRLLIDLNIQCEGFHLIEHILLRPLAGAVHEELELPPNEDYFAHRISLIFPGWTARCNDHDFRSLAEETVRLNVPAHIYAEFYWLGFHEMYEWEALYANWLDLKAREGVHLTVLDRASARLLRYLLDLRARKQQHRADRP
ncbi:MAG: hypothetical protein PVI52_06285, partial [Chromatiales bacterium]